MKKYKILHILTGLYYSKSPANVYQFGFSCWFSMDKNRIYSFDSFEGASFCIEHLDRAYLILDDLGNSIEISGINEFEIVEIA